MASLQFSGQHDGSSGTQIFSHVAGELFGWRQASFWHLLDMKPGLQLPRVEHRMAGDRVTWSAPLFFNATGLGLGATIGYHEVNSLVLLDTQRSVEALTNASVSHPVCIAFGALLHISIRASPSLSLVAFSWPDHISVWGTLAMVIPISKHHLPAM